MDDKNLCLMLEQYVKQLLYEYIFSVILSLKYYIQSKGVHITMDIYVDADACPVVRIVETVAQKHGIPVTLLCDTNHVLNSDYSQIKVVGAGADAVDYKLISMCRAGDIVVSQDYGVAAMALGKGAYAIHQSGKWYTDENIDQMLMERHLNKKARRKSHKNHLEGERKGRTGSERWHIAGKSQIRFTGPC